MKAAPLKHQQCVGNRISPSCFFLHLQICYPPPKKSYQPPSNQPKLILTNFKQTWAANSTPSCFGSSHLSNVIVGHRMVVLWPHHHNHPPLSHPPHPHHPHPPHQHRHPHHPDRWVVFWNCQRLVSDQWRCSGAAKGWNRERFTKG